MSAKRACGGALIAAFALSLSLAVPAASAAPAATLGVPDYARGVIPVSVALDAGVTSVEVELHRAGGSESTLSATKKSSGTFGFEVELSADTTAVIKAFRSGTEVWSETLPLKRADYSPSHPTLSLAHDQLVRPGSDLSGTRDSKTTTLTVQARKGTRWSSVASRAVTADALGAFALADVKLPTGHLWLRVVSSNGFGSSTSTQHSVYNLGKVTRDARLVLVDRSQTRVWVIRGGIVKFTCRCAVGMPWTPTPTGRFKLGKRHRTPNSYWGPWRLRLWRLVKVHGVTRRVATRYYIHGTSVPSSIGDYASHGCIRLHNKNIRKLSTVIDGYITVIRE